MRKRIFFSDVYTIKAFLSFWFLSKRQVEKARSWSGITNEEVNGPILRKCTPFPDRSKTIGSRIIEPLPPPPSPRSRCSALQRSCLINETEWINWFRMWCKIAFFFCRFLYLLYLFNYFYLLHIMEDISIEIVASLYRKERTLMAEQIILILQVRPTEDRSTWRALLRSPVLRLAFERKSAVVHRCLRRSELTFVIPLIEQRYANGNANFGYNNISPHSVLKRDLVPSTIHYN